MLSITGILQMRIAVIGNSGGGKSVLARGLASKHNLPYCEVDALLWRPGWQLAPERKYATDHAEWVAQPRWIMDGLGRRDSVPARLERTTHIVLVDLPLWMHFALAAERQIAWAGGRLEHPPAGLANMAPTVGLFKTIWEVDRDWMPEIRGLIDAEEARGKRVRRIVSTEELDINHISDWAKWIVASMRFSKSPWPGLLA